MENINRYIEGERVPENTLVLLLVLIDTFLKEMRTILTAGKVSWYTPGRLVKIFRAAYKLYRGLKEALS